jgi:hypothetical protein
VSPTFRCWARSTTTAWRFKPPPEPPSAATLLGSAAVPLAILIVLFSIQGVLSAFWFWTFQYASEYASRVPLSSLASSLRHGFDAISTRPLGLRLLAGAGVTALWWSAWPQPRRSVSRVRIRAF